MVCGVVCDVVCAAEHVPLPEVGAAVWGPPSPNGLQENPSPVGYCAQLRSHDGRIRVTNGRTWSCGAPTPALP
ncbi:hypothetical protein Slala03_26190 [Streptomyces lavendulae subsp. lavendulae]|nr:hypothetical protein Slala03_26190 [Streptomyces lavendulae subsp. lavendulae]